MKKLFGLFIAAALAAQAAFGQQISIGSLPNGGLMQSTDQVPVNRGGVTMKATPFTSPASGSLLVSNGTSAPSGIAPVNGNCLIAQSNVWAPGSCVPGGSFIADSFVPTSAATPANGLYLPATNTPGIAANGNVVTRFLPTGASVDYLTMQGGATGSPGIVSLGVGGSDSHISLSLKSLGTTTTGGQYLGAGDVSGDQNFFINGHQALKITDTYWNPNISYAGPTNSWPVLSSGQGVAGGGPGPDIIGGIYSVDADPATYNSSGTGIASGLSLLIASKGPSGQIHFTSNGWIGGVTISSPSTNPGGNDAYGIPNQITLIPTAAGTNASPSIGTSASGNGADTAIGLKFYNFGTGPYTFGTGNGNQQLSINHVASAVNSVQINGGSSGNDPMVWASGGAGNIRLALGGSDTTTGGVDIINGAQFYPGAGFAYLARFFGSFGSPDWLRIDAATGAGLGAIISTDSVSDTNAPITIKGKGTGATVLGGHISSIAAGTSAPTCGTGCSSITATSTDARGSFVTGASVTAATLNFGTTYGAAPFCVISDNSTGAIMDLGTVTTTAMPVNFASALSAVTVTYHCTQ